jgi:hypothetical protein
MQIGGQNYASAALIPGKNPLNRRLGGPQSRSGRFGVGKNLLPLLHTSLLFKSHFLWQASNADVQGPPVTA